MSLAYKIRVLVVEDHDMVRKSLVAALQPFPDLEVVGEAKDGDTSVTLAQQLQPDVVLMDMAMKPTNGVDATRLIRQSCPNTQIIALSSFTEHALIQAAFNAGAITYLVKNVSPATLAEAIRRAHAGNTTYSPEATTALIAAMHPEAKVGANLSRREREVLAFMVQGLNNRQIGIQLLISTSTVKNHITSLLAKLNVSNRVQAVTLALQHKLVDKP